MKVVKKIFTALLIIVGLCLAVFLALLGYLFVMPSQSVFGYRLANYSDNTTLTTAYNYSTNEVKFVEINTKNYDLYLSTKSDEANKISATTNRDMYGLFKADQGDVCTKFSYDPVTKTVTATLYEPQGLKLRGDCYVSISLPNSLMMGLEGISLTSTTGNIWVGSNDNTLYSDNLSLNTSEGSVTLDNTALTGELEASIGSGKLTITANTQLNTDSTHITSGNGQTNFNVSTDKILNFGDFVYNNKSTGYLYLGSVSSLEYTGNGGKVYIKAINNLDFSANNTNLTIDNVMGSSYISVRGEGNVLIDTVNAFCDINTNSGNISINNANTKLTLVSGYGNIRVSNATKLIDASTNQGNINISFAENAPFFTSSGSHRQVMATTNSGRIDLSGVDYIDVLVKSSKGYANIIFHDMASTVSSIVTKSAQVYVQVPRGTVLAGDTNGADFIVTIISNTAPTVDAGFGKVDQTADNVYKYLAYGADNNTTAQLEILSENGYVYVTNGIV